MAEQTHRIKRQILQLEVKGVEAAKGFQERLSQLHRRRLADVIAGVCDELSPPDRLHRIDVLQVDLGTIDVGDFDNDFAARLRSALRRALADAIRRIDEHARRSGRQPGTGSGLELLEVFARTGCLPWWAESAEADLIPRTVAELLATSPEPLARLMRQFAGETRSIRRLVAHLPDGMLAGLARLLAPGLRGPGDAPDHDGPDDLAVLLAELSPLLRRRIQTPGLPGHQLRDRLWQLVLHTAAREPSSVSPGELVQLVLVQLIPAARPALRAERGADLSPRLRDLLDSLATESDSEPESESESESESEPESEPEPEPEPESESESDSESDIAARAQSILASLETLRSDDESGPESAPDSNPLARLATILHTVATRSAPGAPRSAERWLDQAMAMGMVEPELLRQCILAIQSTSADTLSRRARSDIAALLLHALDRARGPAPSSHDTTAPGTLAALERGPLPARDAGNETRSSAAARSEKTAPPDSAAARALADLDDVPITNSGLAILWPFLSDFFTRLGLVRDKRFIAGDAAQRAVGLLQYLALPFDPENRPPEYQLALNKVLCGIALDEPFEFGPPITADETDECDALLDAAIGHAPILRDMSHRGFRGTFLLRSGILGVRDGAWLLRVERQSYDLVLDRFPWSWAWVKLPWMRAPLRVEW